MVAAAFDADFRAQVTKVNQLLGNAELNRIINTITLPNFLAYTCNITLDTYTWLLADPRLKTFNKDGTGHIA